MFDPLHGLIALEFIGDQVTQDVTHTLDNGASMNTDQAVGSGDLTGAHNTPLHVGLLMLVGLGVVIALQVLGFRFVVGAGLGGS